jgi:hypothetical protein
MTNGKYFYVILACVLSIGACFGVDGDETLKKAEEQRSAALIQGIIFAELSLNRLG